MANKILIIVFVFALSLSFSCNSHENKGTEYINQTKESNELESITKGFFSQRDSCLTILSIAEDEGNYSDCYEIIFITDWVYAMMYDSIMESLYKSYHSEIEKHIDYLKEHSPNDYERLMRNRCNLYIGNLMDKEEKFYIKHLLRDSISYCFE
ncbi:MAG: hypothetical protein IKK36_05460 [Bacteroidales bacterium]|nr:hypothetical protein [Bacteroidales bacterium]